MISKPERLRWERRVEDRKTLNSHILGLMTQKKTGLERQRGMLESQDHSLQARSPWASHPASLRPGCPSCVSDAHLTGAVGKIR